MPLKIQAKVHWRLSHWQKYCCFFFFFVKGSAVIHYVQDKYAPDQSLAWDYAAILENEWGSLYISFNDAMTLILKYPLCYYSGPEEFRKNNEGNSNLWWYKFKKSKSVSHIEQHIQDKPRMSVYFLLLHWQWAAQYHFSSVVTIVKSQDFTVTVRQINSALPRLIRVLCVLLLFLKE